MRLRPDLCLALLLVTSTALAETRAAVVVLRWDPVAEAAEYELQIASDKAFTPPLALEARVDVAGHRWRSLPTQTFYWRVRSVDAEGREGPWSVVKAIGRGVQPPGFERPSANARLACTARCVADVVLVADPLIDRYLIEYWADGDERNVKRVDSPASHAELELGAPGRFWVRAGAVDIEGRRVEPGAAQSFELVSEAPVAIYPTADAEVAVALPGAVTFRWAARPGDTDFELELRPPAGELRRVPASTTSVDLTLEDFGPHAFRLRARSSEASAWIPFTVLAPAPTVASPANGATFVTRGGQKRVRFDWGAAPAALVELSPDGSFDGPARFRVTLEAGALFVPVGMCAWRLRAEDARGSLSSWTPVRWMEVAGGDSLEPPVITAPEEGAFISGADVSLQWGAVPGAERYEVSVAQQGAPAKSLVAERNAIRFAAPAEGPLRLAMRAVDEDDAVSRWSPVRTIHRGLAPVFSASIGLPLYIDADDDVRIPIVLRDAAGNPVAATPTVEALSGELSAVSPTEYSYRAPSDPGEDRTSGLVVTERGFSHRQPLHVRTRTRLLRFGVGAAYGTNFGQLSGPLTLLDASVRTPLLSRRVLALARLGVLVPTANIPLPGALGAADVRWTAGSLLAAYEHPLRRASLYAGAGPQAVFTTVTIGESAESRWTMGAQAVLGVLARLPVGLLRGELAIGVGRAEGELARMRTGLLTLSVGYAWEP